MFTILLLSRSQMSTAFGGSCCLRGGESIFFSLYSGIYDISVSESSADYTAVPLMLVAFGEPQ